MFNKSGPLIVSATLLDWCCYCYCHYCCCGHYLYAYSARLFFFGKFGMEIAVFPSFGGEFHMEVSVRLPEVESQESIDGRIPVTWLVLLLLLLLFVTHRSCSCSCTTHIIQGIPADTTVYLATRVAPPERGRVIAPVFSMFIFFLN